MMTFDYDKPVNNIDLLKTYAEKVQQMKTGQKDNEEQED